MLTMLLEQVKSHAPQVRIQALCALTMLEETRVLDLLVHMWNKETHPEVREAITWAGTQIRLAQERGYTTEAAMAQAFHSQLFKAEQDIRQQHLIAQVEANRERAQPGRGRMPRALPPGIFGMASDTTGRQVAGAEGKLPPRPTASDIGMCLSRLDDPDPGVRAASIVQLRDFNNPVALGPLAQRFVNDPDPAVRQVAQYVGKLIYFSALYWEAYDAREAARRLSDPGLGDMAADWQKRLARQQ